LTSRCMIDRGGRSSAWVIALSSLLPPQHDWQEMTTRG
jgi:hypothetical protein